MYIFCFPLKQLVQPDENHPEVPMTIATAFLLALYSSGLSTSPFTAGVVSDCTVSATTGSGLSLITDRQGEWFEFQACGTYGSDDGSIVIDFATGVLTVAGDSDWSLPGDPVFVDMDEEAMYWDLDVTGPYGPYILTVAVPHDAVGLTTSVPWSGAGAFYDDMALGVVLISADGRTFGGTPALVYPQDI